MGDEQPRKRIAAILTWYTVGSHSDVLVGKFLPGRGIPADDGFHPLRVDLVSMYIDQCPKGELVEDSLWGTGDIGTELAAEHGVPLYSSINLALCCGGSELAVDGVILIGEHGDYPWNEKGQHLFPRKYFMEQILGVFASSGRSVPVFNDKHLSYNWHDALWMYEKAQELAVPFMAGSSLVNCYRNPYLEHDFDAPIEEAIAVGFSGLDIYGAHTLEVLQCMVERRRGARCILAVHVDIVVCHRLTAETLFGVLPGGETGVVAVTYFEGQNVWDAADAGLWSMDLAEAACATIQEVAPDTPGVTPGGTMKELCKFPGLILIDYADGFRGGVLMLNDYIQALAYAARMEGGKIEACEFYCDGHGGPPGGDRGLYWRYYAHFAYLALNIEEMMVTGKPTYPVERVLLTSGVLEAAIDSRYNGAGKPAPPHKEFCLDLEGERVVTPWLRDIAYSSYTQRPCRPHGPRPAGALITDPDDRTPPPSTARM